MKKDFPLIGLVTLFLLAGIVVIGCSGDTPAKVVKKLHVAIEKEDAKAIGQLMTPEGAQIIIMTAEKSKGAIIAYGGIEKAEEIINGNNAVVKVVYKNGETNDFDLVKIDGKWKVSMEK